MTELDAANLSLTETQLIEASAGTGKTYTITNLCLRLLLGRGRPPLPINQIERDIRVMLEYGAPIND